MNYSKTYINEISKSTSFIASNVEKVIRLLDVLDFIFNNSSFCDALVLKGGTAINLIYSNLSRLSVDIDLDYHRHLEKEKAKDDRQSIIAELDNYMEKEGYNPLPTRNSAILFSRTYSYLNALGNKDNIKVEINFINRISLYPTHKALVNHFGRKIFIKVLKKEELYGMKIAALIDRSKPRDLYDINYLFSNLKDIDLAILRKTTIFYLSLDGIFKIDELLYSGINAISYQTVKKELFPVLKKGENFDCSSAKNKVIKELHSLLSINQDELLYLDKFSKRNYEPHILFDSEAANRAIKHPMAKWKILNMK